MIQEISKWRKTREASGKKSRKIEVKTGSKYINVDMELMRIKTVGSGGYRAYRTPEIEFFPRAGNAVFHIIAEYGNNAGSMNDTERKCKAGSKDNPGSTDRI